MKKLTITKEFQWDCAHRLHDPDISNIDNQKIFGKCNNMHGHTYKMFVTISSDKLVNGMVINFVELKKIVNELIVERFDHKTLNDDELYTNRLTTCEVQIQDIWDILEPKFTEIGITIEKIKLYETPTSYAELIK